MKRPNAYFIFFQFFLILSFNCFVVSLDLYGWVYFKKKPNPNNNYDLCICSCYTYIVIERIDISQYCGSCIKFILNLINFCSVSCKYQLTQLCIPTFYLPKQMLTFFRRDLSLPNPVLYFRERGISVIDIIVQTWGFWGISCSWLKSLAASKDTLF